MYISIYAYVFIQCTLIRTPFQMFIKEWISSIIITLSSTSAFGPSVFSKRQYRLHEQLVCFVGIQSNFYIHQCYCTYGDDNCRPFPKFFHNRNFLLVNNLII